MIKKLVEGKNGHVKMAFNPLYIGVVTFLCVYIGIRCINVSGVRRLTTST